MIGFQIEVKLAGDKSESSKTKSFKSLPMMLFISSKSNKGLSSDLNDGSPTLVVPPPIKVIGIPPNY
mgnify:CR=1 FL=1